jgi:NitT/TauT family transport system ATP-binding protein
LLEVRGLSIGFGGRILLEKASFRLAQGGFGVIIGRSGCGKTSLFRGLAGLVPCREGIVSWKGRPVENLSGLVAFMQQKDLLLPWASILENALLPMRVSGNVGREDRQQALDLLHRFGLGGFETALPGQVSGGMRQRCALARTILSGKEIVLLDEPLSSLDALTRSRLQRELLRLQSEFKRTVLMVTHDVEEALLLADRVFVLGGTPARIDEILALGDPKPRETDLPVIVKNRKLLLETLGGGHGHAA